ncbi:5554_t:CDS:2, partial [Entrophospora sp. SA101]
MKHLPTELIIEIFKYIEIPISLILVNKEFCRICTSAAANAAAKSVWALTKFGRIHVLFFSVLLGKTFITVDVVKSLLALKANLSRYFIQRLLLQYGQYDQDLIKLKLQDNNNNSQEIDREKFKVFQNSIKTPWSSDISFDVFITLLNEAEARFAFTKNKDFQLKEKHRQGMV